MWNSHTILCLESEIISNSSPLEMMTQLIDAFSNPLFVAIFDLNDRKILATAFLQAKKEAPDEVKEKIDAVVKMLATTPLDEDSAQIKMFRSIAKGMFKKQVKNIKKTLPKQMKSVPAGFFDSFVKDVELFLGFSWFTDEDRKEIMEMVSVERNHRQTGITNYN